MARMGGGVYKGTPGTTTTAVGGMPPRLSSVKKASPQKSPAQQNAAMKAGITKVAKNG